MEVFSWGVAVVLGAVGLVKLLVVYAKHEHYKEYYQSSVKIYYEGE